MGAASNALHESIDPLLNNYEIREAGRVAGEHDPRALSGRQEGERIGREDSRSDSTREVLIRFRSIVDTSEAPNLDDSPVPPEFNGISDGYRRLIGEMPSLQALMQGRSVSDRNDQYNWYECNFDAFNGFPETRGTTALTIINGSLPAILS